MGALPSDACPFSRPFPKDFAECPAFEPVEYVPVTLMNDPLTPTSTCRHLATGNFGKSLRHKYGQCALGDARGRFQWLKDRVASQEKALGDDLAQLADVAR